MPATNLSFAKVVATPTSKSWSQAYNAGGLFIVLSLTSENEELQKELPSHGKQTLSNLEAEFFGLEDKNFESIKEALTSLPKLPETVEVSLSLVTVKDDTLYAFILGSGRITLKRHDRIGVILESSTNDYELHSSSGYLESDDLILIQTAAFAESVPPKTIREALENTLPNDIAETISPSVHGGSEGGASAIILSYKGISHVTDSEDTLEGDLSTFPQKSHEINTDETEEILPPSHHTPEDNSQVLLTRHELPQETSEEKTGAHLWERIRGLIPQSFLPHIQLNKQKKIILAVACIFLGLLLVSIIYVRQNSQSSKDHALFEEIYASAKKDFDEGEGLLTLNKSLARDDYTSAKKTLDDAAGKFKPGSKEELQLKELATKVDQRLNELGGSSQATAKEVDATSAPLLTPFTKDSAVIATAGEDSTIYAITGKGITKDDKTVIKNDTTWSTVKALDVFSGNLYVLDPQNGLIKFISTGTDYAQSTYFKGDSPDLKNAAGMAIDSSIYILFSDGSLQKYTRGTKDSFSISGLTKALSSPVSIFTSPDVEHLYILDPGSSRIVKLDKSGAFVGDYSSDIFKSAKTLTVNADEKSAYVLAGNKIYQISL